MIQPIPFEVATRHAQWVRERDNAASIGIAGLPWHQRSELEQWQRNAKEWRHLAVSCPLVAEHYRTLADECDMRYLARLGEIFGV